MKLLYFIMALLCAIAAANETFFHPTLIPNSNERTNTTFPYSSLTMPYPGNSNLVVYTSLQEASKQLDSSITASLGKPFLILYPTANNKLEEKVKSEFLLNRGKIKHQ